MEIPSGLKEPLEVICGRRGRPETAAVLAATDALDAHAEDRTLPRSLRHYLKRRNYGRALAYVELLERGENPEDSLGHHP